MLRPAFFANAQCGFVSVGAYVAFFFVLVVLLLLIDRVAAMPPRAKTVVQVALLVGCLVLAFQVGSWQGTVLLIAPVVALELGRLIHKRVKAGA